FAAGDRVRRPGVALSAEARMSIGRAGGSRGAGALESSGAGAGRTGSVHSAGGTDGPHRFARATGSGAGAPAEPDVASDRTPATDRGEPVDAGAAGSGATSRGRADAGEMGC